MSNDYCSLMAIDPGVEGAFAFWKESTVEYVERPSVWGTFGSTGSSEDWQVRVDTAWRQLRTRIFLLKPQRVVCEWPELFAHNEASLASNKRGDLMKLMYVVGGISKICHGMSIPIQLARVFEWKGQLSKSMVIKRIKDRFPGATLPFKSHEWDAVGIGLWARGKF